MTPLISTIMPTMPGRRRFVHQAVKYFLRQTYPEKEILVVDSPPGAPEAFAGYPSSVRYLVKEGSPRVGPKMNFGAARAAGDVLHKMDDDDWYHPKLLAEMWELMKADPENTVPRVAGAPFFLLREWKLKLAVGKVWILGGTIPFHRRFWEKNPFREDLEGGSDYAFRTAAPFREAVLPRMDRYVLIRHGVGHTWKCHKERDVDALFAEYPDHALTPEEFFGADCQFYRELWRGLFQTT